MYVVDGFEFQTKEEARQAKKESDGIRYIKDQTDMSDPDTVYKLYLRLNKPGYFFTPVGLSFLVELQEYLHTIPYIKNEDIRPIYIPEDKKAVVEVKKQTEGYKKKFHVALFFTIVLSAAIVTMFLSLIHISEPTRQAEISYAVFCLKKKNKQKKKQQKNRHKKNDT